MVKTDLTSLVVVSLFSFKKQNNFFSPEFTISLTAEYCWILEAENNKTSFTELLPDRRGISVAICSGWQKLDLIWTKISIFSVTSFWKEWNLVILYEDSEDGTKMILTSLLLSLLWETAICQSSNLPLRILAEFLEPDLLLGAFSSNPKGRFHALR